MESYPNFTSWIQEMRPQVQDVRPLLEVKYDIVDHMPNYDKKIEATRCKRSYCTGLL